MRNRRRSFDMTTVPVIPGDGIGPEIVDAGKAVLEAAADAEGFRLEWEEFPYGADHYLETDEVLPESALDELGRYDAIYFGSIGDPRVEPGVLEKGIILKLRFAFDQYVNLRPVKLLEGIESPLRDKTPEDIDFTVVRENTEDFYVGIGGRSTGKSSEHLTIERELYETTFDLDVETDAEEIAYQIGQISREGTRRVAEYAFEHAEESGHRRLTAIDKANVLTDIYGLWREVIDEVSEDYAGIEHEYNYVDAASMWFVKDPEHYETVLAPNTFGDIVTDLGAMLQGGLGLAPGGNINPDGTSMFEPLHGSAPKYAGEDRANPTATIWAGALLLDHIGEERASDRVLEALEDVIATGDVLTKDLGGDVGTSAFADAVAERVREGG